MPDAVQPAKPPHKDRWLIVLIIAAVVVLALLPTVTAKVRSKPN